MAEEACCTCAALLNTDAPIYSSENEKPIHQDPPRRLPCCGRAICATCISKNSRFESYCPFCQVSSGTSSLPQGLRDPPEYSSASTSPKHLDMKPESLDGTEQPPSYTSLDQNSSGNKEVGETPAPDVTHHLYPTDTLASLSLAYAVPLPILRKHNTLYSDHLLSARRTISIPGSHYKGGVSLSTKPVESAEEIERKSKLRKFMVATKCHEYDVAELYLKQADYSLDRALETFRADERWEKENPLQKNGKSRPMQQKDRRKSGVSGGIAGQI